MKQNPYCKFFEGDDKAADWCEMKNKACRRAGNFKDIFCLVDGPENNFAVVDLGTAIDLGSGYQIVG
jgi:hypothetical protein